MVADQQGFYEASEFLKCRLVEVGPGRYVVWGHFLMLVAVDGSKAFG